MNYTPESSKRLGHFFVFSTNCIRIKMRTDHNGQDTIKTDLLSYMRAGLRFMKVLCELDAPAARKIAAKENSIFEVDLVVVVHIGMTFVYPRVPATSEVSHDDHYIL